MRKYWIMFLKPSKRKSLVIPVTMAPAPGQLAELFVVGKDEHERVLFNFTPYYRARGEWKYLSPLELLAMQAD